MRSLLIEFHRFDSLDTGILQGDYLVAASTYPVREYKWPIPHLDFHDLLFDLRYQSESEKRKTALEKIGAIASAMLGISALKELREGDFPLQIDLVVNAAELAAVPFELATHDDGWPVFVVDDQPVELTRRVRFEFAERSVHWPVKPRVLFAWAYPPGAGAEVPAEEHEQALRGALQPWMSLQAKVSDSDVLVILPEASLASLEKACNDAVDAKKPFTHIHLLAHGYPVGRRNRERFGLALHDADGDLDAVEPEKIKDALAPVRKHAVVITLAACDSANRDNPLSSEKSIAHELHVSGTPVVVASQLPLTVPGSGLLVERFYGALLSGNDVRVALHEARVALYESREQTGHDWASVVGYISLPEGYAEHLLDVRLASLLAAMESARKWSDESVESEDTSPALFKEIENRLKKSIGNLDQFLKETENTPSPGVIEENIGLLGSAEKSLAELYFEGSKTKAKQKQGQKALERSLGWYRRGYEHNLSHHWTGVQCLSLEAVLTGSISDPSYWYAAAAAAEIDRKNPEEFWAHGSLAELYMLAPMAGLNANLDKATEVLGEMKQRVKQQKAGDFPILSTRRQLSRYVRWWTNVNGFFPGKSDLANEAKELIKQL